VKNGGNKLGKLIFGVVFDNQTIFLKYKIWVNEFKKWNSSEISSFD